MRSGILVIQRILKSKNIAFDKLSLLLKSKFLLKVSSLEAWQDFFRWSQEKESLWFVTNTGKSLISKQVLNEC